MTTTTSPTAVVVSVEPLFTEAERIALAGFLAGYSGLTRDDGYALDLRMFSAWCQHPDLHLFQARRADIECFGRDMESCRRARATIARRLCTISGFYRYAVEEELLDHSPAEHPAERSRRPRLGGSAGSAQQSRARPRKQSEARPRHVTSTRAVCGAVFGGVESGAEGDVDSVELSPVD